jgi:hypothetical protein
MSLFSRKTVFAASVLGLVPVFSWTGLASASDITPEKVVELVNRDRVEEGLAALAVSDELSRAARAKAEDMARERYFAHTSPTGATPWQWIDRSGYAYRYAGENLAIRFVDAEEQQQAWMGSPRHRENILSPKYEDIGVAVKEAAVEDGGPAFVVVQMFGLREGRPLPTAPQVSSERKGSPEQAGGASVSQVSDTRTKAEPDILPAVPSGTGIRPFAAQGLGFLAVAALIAWGGTNLVRCGRAMGPAVVRRWRFGVPRALP